MSQTLVFCRQIFYAARLFALHVCSTTSCTQGYSRCRKRWWMPIAFTKWGHDPPRVTNLSTSGYSVEYRLSHVDTERLATGMPKQAWGDLRCSGFSIQTRCAGDWVERGLGSSIPPTRLLPDFFRLFYISSHHLLFKVSDLKLFHCDRVAQRILILPTTSMQLPCCFRPTAWGGPPAARVSSGDSEASARAFSPRVCVHS